MSTKHAGLVIIDDDPLDVEVLERVFQKYGLDCPRRSFCKPQKALQYLEENRARPHLILLDYNMPGLMAPDLLKRLLDHPLNCMIIVLSGGLVEMARESMEKANTKETDMGHRGILGAIIKYVSKDILVPSNQQKKDELVAFIQLVKKSTEIIF